MSASLIDPATQEAFAKMVEVPSVVAPVQHIFTSGLYTRLIFIPAGAMILGKVHKHPTTNILMQGEIQVYQGEDKERLSLKAPFVYESEAGVSKVAYAITDVIWANVHVTDLTDVDEIEEEFTYPVDVFIEGNPCLGVQ